MVWFDFISDVSIWNVSIYVHSLWRKVLLKWVNVYFCPIDWKRPILIAKYQHCLAVWGDEDVIDDGTGKHWLSSLFVHLVVQMYFIWLGQYPLSICFHSFTIIVHGKWYVKHFNFTTIYLTMFQSFLKNLFFRENGTGFEATPFINFN